jgi:predicted GNAT superfamily acetyltransferase
MIRAVPFSIRDFEQFSDYDACERLQMEVWSFPPSEAVPAMHLVALHRFGGVCIGAFDGDCMVGFVCGFTAIVKGSVFHHSHMLAVLSDYRGGRLGEKLKWAQRERVRREGLALINWTFDPLQAPNANLNINRLCAIARKYRVNLYGESDSPLHGGIPTDRFEVEWSLESHSVIDAERGDYPDWTGWEGLPCVNPTVYSASGLLTTSGEELRLDLEEPIVLVEIPRTITAVMSKDKELVLDWRLTTRRIFQVYFERGYVVRAVHRKGASAFYRLEEEEASVD